MLIYNNLCQKKNLIPKKYLNSYNIYSCNNLDVLGVLPDAGDRQPVTPAEGQVLELVQVRHDVGDGLFCNDRGVREI